MKEKLEVEFILQDITQLLDRVKADPLAYENMYWQLSEISDVASKLTGLILEAENRESVTDLSIEAANKSSDMALEARVVIL